MGVGLAPRFDKKLRGVDFDSDGKGLTLFFDLLNDICEDEGLTPFRDFTDDEALEALDRGKAKYKEPWRSPSDGLKTIHGLISVLESEPKRVEKTLRSHVKYLLADLKDLEHCLEIAKKRKARFYLMFW